MSFTLLWQKILRSSLWVQESKETRIVWIALLALKDKDGVIQSSLVGLADAAKVTVEECNAALETLMSPDLNDTSGVEEGRRIRRVQGGWQIINNDLYRFSTEAKREFWRQSQQDYRQTKKVQAPAKAALPTPPVNPAAVPEKPPKPKLVKSSTVDQLLAIYDAYPRKISRPNALRAIAKALTKIDAEKLLNLTKEYAQARIGEPDQYTPHPATWFNAERYKDDPATWKPNAPVNRQVPQSVDRNLGNANEGKAHLYKGLGSVSVPDRP